MAAGTDNAFAGGNRFAITACAIVATLMQALDTDWIAESLRAVPLICDAVTLTM